MSPGRYTGMRAPSGSVERPRRQAGFPLHPEGERRSAPAAGKKRLGGWGCLCSMSFWCPSPPSLAGVGWIWANDVLALNKSARTYRRGWDRRGDTVGQVADKLEEQGLIRYKMVFKLFCSLTHTSGLGPEREEPRSPRHLWLEHRPGLPGPHLQHGLLLHHRMPPPSPYPRA